MDDLVRALSTLLLTVGVGTGTWLALHLGYARARARRTVLLMPCTSFVRPMRYALALFA